MVGSEGSGDSQVSDEGAWFGGDSAGLSSSTMAANAI